MHTEYYDCVLAALCARYCDCCAMSLWHQVLLVLCIVYCVPGIKSVMYWVLGHWILGLWIRRNLQGHCTHLHKFHLICKVAKQMNVVCSTPHLHKLHNKYCAVFHPSSAQVA